MWIFIIIFLILTVIFTVWPEISLYVITFCLPIIGWTFYVGSWLFPFVDFLSLAALSAFSLRAAYSFISKKSNQPAIKWPLFFPFFIFFVFSLVSSLLSSDPMYSLWYIVRWPLFLYFAYIFLPYNLINSGKILKRTAIALVLSSLVVLVGGYFSLYGQDWRDSFFRLKSIAWQGIYPFGENHNLIAEFLNVGAFLIIMIRLLTKDQRVKRILDIAFIFSALGIILTFSRAGWITLLLQAAIYAWYYLRSKNYQITNIIMIAVVILITLSPLFWKMNQLQENNVSSTEDRWLLTEIAWQAYSDRPYFGYGSGQFVNLVDDNIRFKAKYGAPIDSHGMLQKILAENGLFGLAAWLFILVYLLKIGGQSLKKYYRDNPWILPLFLAAAGGLFFQFFNTSYYKGKVWLPIAMSLAAVRLLESKYAKKDKGKN